MIEWDEITEGSRYVVCMLRRPQRDDPIALEYIEGNLGDATALRLLADIERIAEMGPPRNTEKWRTFRGHDGLAEIKRDQARLLCFFDGRRLIITHGFTKKRGETPSVEIDRAKRLRDEYYAAAAERGREK